MGTVVERKRKDGSIAYMAQISIMRDRKVVLRETKTFERKGDAVAWVNRRERELAAPGALDAATRKKAAPTLASAIDQYLEESQRDIGRTKSQVLATIKASDLGGMACDQITSLDIVAYGATLRSTVQAQTVGNYMSHLASVFAIARPAWGLPLDKAAMDDATVVMKRLGYTAKSRQRDRRPTLDELDRLLTHFERIEGRRAGTVPMVDVVLFAVFSTRRQGEITRISWADLNGARILVRDMKNPGDKIGNNVACDLPPEAMAVVERQARKAEVIFPYTTDAIGAAFTRACKVLAIEDLRFHDLRHEGVSRLFEMGWTIPQVATVSGHRSWQSLKRYTHLRQQGDKYAGWKWNPLTK